MSGLTKILVTGKVVRNPEKRFTNNNLAITTFAMDIGVNNEEKLVRVVSLGKTAETVASSVTKGQRVVVDGKLQTNTVKTEGGLEKKIVEISAQNVELMSSSVAQDSSEESVSFESDFDLSEEISDDLIGEDEIPF